MKSRHIFLFSFFSLTSASCFSNSIYENFELRTREYKANEVVSLGLLLQWNGQEEKDESYRYQFEVFPSLEKDLMKCMDFVHEIMKKHKSSKPANDIILPLSKEQKSLFFPITKLEQSLKNFLYIFSEDDSIGQKLGDFLKIFENIRFDLGSQQINFYKNNRELWRKQIEHIINNSAYPKSNELVPPCMNPIFEPNPGKFELRELLNTLQRKGNTLAIEGVLLYATRVYIAAHNCGMWNDEIDTTYLRNT